jgi:hypothetical protein
VLASGVLVAVERLLIKLRQPASRADELVELRGRLRDQRNAAAGDNERALAHAIRTTKLAIADALHGVSSCSSCASAYPWPLGHYAGGACCGGVTADIFDDNEVGALALAGTRTRDLVPPHDDHAGCAFRGATGCSLAAANRPARCVHFVCDALRRELHARGQLDAIEGALATLDREMREFAAMRRARIDREIASSIVSAIESSR